MNLRLALATASLAALGLAATETPAWAQLCTANPTQCIADVQNSGGVVNDIFKDSMGHTGDQLPLYGKLFNQWAGCTPYEVSPGCAGTSNATPTPAYNCPGNYSCASLGGAFATASTFLNTLDHTWWQPCRLQNPALTTVGGMTCPVDWTCITDQVGGNYLPWEGLVFDLGGPSNKVAIFAENDHGPQPCESLEYTVFLTDNPMANQMTDIVLHPATDGVDPMKWNRAVLSKIFTWGWFNTRAPDPADFGASCGDTTDYAVEDDSFAQVYALPCGITFRYASIVAGNDGLDFPNCTYHSSEAELDAVAGLTESGAGVCPDNDHDGYVDCNCMGAPAPPGCDCNDADPNVHPGAPEACDATVDNNCDGTIGTACPAGTVCYESICDATCSGTETASCAPGSTCSETSKGKLCTPVDCGCAPGQVCVNNMCVDACKGVVCPGSLVCQDGNCVDPCAHLQCPAGQTCQAGICAPPCNCFAGNLGCPAGGTEVCDTGNSNQCVAPACQNVTCPTGQSCDPTSGTCVGFCNNNVMCPDGQKCVEPTGCVPLCTGVTCPSPLTCDPTTGMCVDDSCMGITCFAPEVCMAGKCVMTDGGSGAGGGTGTTGTGNASGAGGAGAGGAGGEAGSGGANSPGAKSKCGCRTVGEGDGEVPGAGALALLGLAVMTGRRRRGGIAVRPRR